MVSIERLDSWAGASAVPDTLVPTADSSVCAYWKQWSALDDDFKDFAVEFSRFNSRR
jgi:hypothetical protein